MPAETRFERRKGSYLSDTLMRAAAGILLTISMALGAWALSKVNELSIKQAEAARDHIAVCDRVKGLELRTDQRFEMIDRQLERINEKLDRLIQRTGRVPR